MVATVTTGWKQATANRTYGSGAAWSNPANAYSSNDSYATSAVQKSNTSLVLRLTGFGFTTSDIPEGAVIVGVEVQVERHASAASNLLDNVVQLVIDNSPTAASTAERFGSNKASASTWATTVNVSATYGGAADQWGMNGDTLTDAMIRSAAFGLDFQVRNNNALQARTANVDNVQIRVTYTMDREGALATTSKKPNGALVATVHPFARVQSSTKKPTGALAATYTQPPTISVAATTKKPEGWMHAATASPTFVAGSEGDHTTVTRTVPPILSTCFGIASSFVAGQSGVATHITVDIASATVPTIQFFLFSDIAGAPGSVLTNTSPMATATGVVTAALTTNPSIVAGQTYWLAVMWSGSGTVTPNGRTGSHWEYNDSSTWVSVADAGAVAASLTTQVPNNATLSQPTRSKIQAVTKKPAADLSMTLGDVVPTGLLATTTKRPTAGLTATGHTASTFGTTTSNGGSGGGSGTGRIFGTKVTTTATTWLVKVAINVASVNVQSGNVRPVVYADNSGTPGVLLAYGESVPCPASPGVWEFLLIDPVQVASGTPLWIGLQAQSAQLNYAMATGTAGRFDLNPASYGVTPPSSGSGANIFGGSQYAMSVTGTDAAPSLPPRQITGAVSFKKMTATGAVTVLETRKLAGSPVLDLDFVRGRYVGPSGPGDLEDFVGGGYNATHHTANGLGIFATNDNRPTLIGEALSLLASEDYTIYVEYEWVGPRVTDQPFNLIQGFDASGNLRLDNYLWDDGDDGWAWTYWSDAQFGSYASFGSSYLGQVSRIAVKYDSTTTVRGSLNGNAAASDSTGIRDQWGPVTTVNIGFYSEASPWPLDGYVRRITLMPKLADAGLVNVSAVGPEAVSTSFKKPTATGGVTVVEELPTIDVSGEASFRKMTATGALSTAHVVTATAAFKKPTVTAAGSTYYGVTGATTFKKPTISATGLNSLKVTGAPSFKKATATGGLATRSLITATVSFKKPTINASGTNHIPLTGAFAFKKATATGGVGSYALASGVVVFKKPTVTGMAGGAGQIAGSTSFKKPTVVGAAVAVPTAVGSTNFKKPSSSGVLFQIPAVTGDALAKRPQAEGTMFNVPGITGGMTFRKPQATGGLYTFIAVSGSASFKKLTGSGAMATRSMISGAPVMKKLTGSGVLVTRGVANGSTTFKKPTLTGGITTMAVISGTAAFKKPTVAGEAQEATGFTGATVFKRPTVEGDAFSMSLIVSETGFKKPVVSGRVVNLMLANASPDRMVSFRSGSREAIFNENREVAFEENREVLIRPTN